MENKERFFVGGVEVLVVRRKMKSIKITIKESGDVVLSCPHIVPIKDAIRFAERNAAWIRQSLNEKLVAKKIKFREGDTVSLWGKDYAVKFVNDKKNRVKIEGECLVFYVPPNASVADLNRFYLAFCKREVKRLLPEYFEKWCAATGLEVKGFSVRDMKTRWGSCNPKKQTISINAHIIEKPLMCLDYLVLHEVAHIKEPSHNQDFKNFLSKYMPDWKIFRKMLKK